LFSFNPTTALYQTLFTFNFSQTGGKPTQRLTYGNNGRLFGVVDAIPEYVQGGVFSYDVTNGQYTIVVVGDPVSPANLGRFVSSLTLGTDGKLYGINKEGDHARGLIYSINPSTYAFTAEYHFPSTYSGVPRSKIIQAADGKFYGGAAPSQLSDQGPSQGFLYSYDPVSDAVSPVFDFAYYYEGGAKPYNSLVPGPGGELFGTASEGGQYGEGTLFSYNTTTGVFRKRFDFSQDNGRLPRGNLTLGLNGKFYGLAFRGGSLNGGTLYSLDPATDAFVRLHEFEDGVLGGSPEGSLLLNDDGIFYGLASSGGTNNLGVIFSFNPATNTYTKRHDFNAADGAFPHGSFVKGPGGKLYAMTTDGGANQQGNIISFDPSTNNVVSLHDFSLPEGILPFGNLLLASDGLFYGLTSSHGANGGGAGTLFSFNVNTNMLTVLYHFAAPSGPLGTLMEGSNGKLYGMTLSGGADGLGTVFSFNPLDNSYSLLQSFNETNGANPFYGALVEPSSGGVTSSKYVKVNLYGGVNPYNNAEWNNWNLNASLASGNLKYSNGTLSGISAILSQQTAIADNGVPYNATMAPPEVVRYTSYSTSGRTLTISGLDNSKSYNLELYASRKGVSNNTTRFTIGSATVDVVTDNNLGNKASFTALTPVSGSITVNISKLNSYNYINGFILTETATTSSNTPPVVNAGNDQTITLPANSVVLNGSASDANGTVAGYSWSKIAGPASYTFSSTTVANPTVSNLVQGTYTFRLTATDNQGAAAYDDVNITVEPAAAGPSRFVKVNLYGGVNPYNNSEWNNWNSTASLSSGSLKYSDGTVSSINATLSGQTAISDNGVPYNASMAPSEVIRYTSYSTSNRTFTISGLDNSKTYNLELYASRKGVSNNTTRFTIGSATVDILTDNNLGTKASFVSLTPVGGTITVTISRLNTYNYLNGFVLTENGTSASVTRKAPPVMEQPVMSTLSVYPNPARGLLTVQLKGAYAGAMTVQLVNMSGVVVRQFALVKKAGADQKQVSLEGLKQGEYLLRIQTADAIVTKKILKL
jgi:uncharacterized repeat protein (TIGR03803 family)